VGGRYRSPTTDLSSPSGRGTSERRRAGRGGAAGSERDAAPSAADDGAARLHGRQPRARQHHLPRLRLRLLPPLLGTKGTGLTTYLALLHLPFRPPPPLRSLTSGM
jgi:hypothetical protein